MGRSLWPRCWRFGANGSFGRRLRHKKENRQSRTAPEKHHTEAWRDRRLVQISWCATRYVCEVQRTGCRTLLLELSGLLVCVEVGGWQIARARPFSINYAVARPGSRNGPEYGFAVTNFCNRIGAAAVPDPFGMVIAQRRLSVATAVHRRRPLKVQPDCPCADSRPG